MPYRLAIPQSINYTTERPKNQGNFRKNQKKSSAEKNKTQSANSGFWCRHRSIFPGRLQPSIFDANELNFRVRNGNGWNLIAINTGSAYIFQKQSFLKSRYDPYGNRTHDYAVRGRRLSRLTNGPLDAPSGTRTRDPLIKSQLLYHLS